MQKIAIALIIVLAPILPACSSPGRQAPSVVPAHTGLAPTGMPDPGPTALAGAQPALEWNGIPIMPGAIAGEGDAESYVFTIAATSQQVQEYYEAELTRLGWQSSPEGNPSMLIFMRDGEESLTINTLSRNDQTLVLLVKQGSA